METTSHRSPALRLITKATNIIDQLPGALPEPMTISIGGWQRGPCQLLDTCTDSLWNKGKLLLRSGHRLLLLTPDDSQWLDIGNLDIRFKQDIPSVDFIEAMSEVSALRRLLPSQDLELGHMEGTIMDGAGINCAHLSAIELSGADGGTIVDLYTLKGHKKAFRKTAKALQDLGAQAVPDGAAVQALLSYGGHGYRSNPGVPLHPEITVKSAATTMIKTYMEVARRNEPGFIADLDTEYLHDYRVSLRRVRSIISLFKGAYGTDTQKILQDQFSERMRNTNRLRDLDVYLLDKSSYYDMLPPAMHSGLEEIFAAFAQERREEWARLVEIFNSDTYQHDFNEVQSLFSDNANLPSGPDADRPFRQYAAHLIRKRYKKVCKIAQAIDQDTPDATIHRLRLQGKKLRYMLDLSAPLFDKQKIDRIIKSLKQLQNNLGRFNDYSVQQVSLQQFLETRLRQGVATSPAMIEAVGALIGIKHQLQLDERTRIEENFARFHDDKTDRLFDQLFSKAKSSR